MVTKPRQKRYQNSKQKAEKESSKSEFIYKGKKKHGYIIKGSLEATNKDIARAVLTRQHIQVLRIQKKPKPLLPFRKTIKQSDIAYFTRQMATILQAGVSILKALSMIAEGTKHQALKTMIQSIKADLENGSSYKQALQKHPKQFDKLYISLINAGEQSGTLDTMLDRIATYKEKTESIKKKIKKALTYPASVIVIAIIVTIILLLFVIPTFEKLFTNFDAPLPAFTIFVLDLSAWVQIYWPYLFLGTLALSYGLYHIHNRYLKFREWKDKWLLKLPIFGSIINKACIARFSRTLSTTFASGMKIVDALQAVATSTGNLMYEYAVLQIREDIINGVNMQQAVKNTNLFPTMVEQMIAIGEESGQLDHMLAKVAAIYEEEVDLAVDGLSDLLEPILIVIMGILVGGMVTAMYMPIFQLGQVI